VTIIDNSCDDTKAITRKIYDLFLQDSINTHTLSATLIQLMVLQRQQEQDPRNDTYAE
jgi:hypothetical protein